MWSLVGDRLQLFRVVKAHKTAILAMVADSQVLTVCLLYWYKSAITGTKVQRLTSKFCGLSIPGCDMLHELAAAESIYDA